MVKICPVVMKKLFFEGFFFLFLALAATLCGEVEQFEQFWQRISQGTILSSFVELSQGIMEMLFEVVVFFFVFFFFNFLTLAAILSSGAK